MRPAVAALAVALLAAPCVLQAQTIAPVVVEYTGRARGKFELVNPGLEPMNVVLEPLSFVVDGAGQPTYSSLDSTVHLRLSASSFRVAPNEIYTVFYEATADRRPAWFTVYATITGPRPAGGLQVAVRLPHTVYLLTRENLTKDSVALLEAGVDSAQRIVATVENRSPVLGRVKQVEVWSREGRKSYPGFPLFPGQRRAIQLDWAQSMSPERLVLEFGAFAVEHPIAR